MTARTSETLLARKPPCSARGGGRGGVAGRPGCPGRFRGGRVYDRADLRDLVGREAALLGVLADHILVRGDVGAVDLVVRNLALDPLYLRSHVVEDVAGGLREPLQLLCRQVPGPRYLPLDHVLGHCVLSFRTSRSCSCHLSSDE